MMKNDEMHFILERFNANMMEKFLEHQRTSQVRKVHSFLNKRIISQSLIIDLDEF